MLILIIGEKMKKLYQKYLDLILEKGTNFTHTQAILINYHKENRPLIKYLVKKLKSQGITDIYLDEEDPNLYHRYLLGSKTEIKNNPYFDKQIWNKYAQKGACFLMLKSEYPALMDDLASSNVALASKLMLDSRSEFLIKQRNNELPWCIAVLPSKTWAEKLFPKEKHSYDKLFTLIATLCLAKESKPAAAWEKLIADSNKRVQKLNKMQIKSLHYTNSLGTDFTVGLSKDALWCGIGQDSLCLVNLPSYEVFTSPDYKVAKGVVYASKPLYYNNQEIDGIYLKFARGKVVDYGAQKGAEILKTMIEAEEAMHYLGEIALVPINSPIAQTGITFGTTLLDENAACHLALGEGFPECRKDSQNLSNEKLKQKHLNVAQNHVDIMIGTDDLKIEAETYQGKKVIIFENGKFVI